mmetsp:Transcript_119190/g.282871  ORF Transcript_119190/g.282871 Transcript_119190/m.282871 type:complete len:317 (+) Transcript_119190:2209-3159(+)
MAPLSRRHPTPHVLRWRPFVAPWWHLTECEDHQGDNGLVVKFVGMHHFEVLLSRSRAVVGIPHPLSVEDSVFELPSGLGNSFMGQCRMIMTLVLLHGRLIGLLQQLGKVRLVLCDVMHLQVSFLKLLLDLFEEVIDHELLGLAFAVLLRMTPGAVRGVLGRSSVTLLCMPSMSLFFLVFLFLVFFLFALLPQLNIGFDRKGQKDLKHDGHSQKVEQRENQPSNVAPLRCCLQRLRVCWNILAEKLREEEGKGHHSIVEVEHEPVLLLVLRVLKSWVALVQDSSEQIDSQSHEEENHAAKHEEDAACCRHHLGDGIG